MKKMTNVETATPEHIWAIFNEIAVSQRELAASQAETDRQMKETDRQMKEGERRLKETDRMLSEKFAETDRLLKEVGKKIGGMGNSHGEFAEEFFYNALLHKQRYIFGEHYDEVLRKNIVNVNKGFEDEYDILLINGRSVCVVEVKYKADSNELAHKVLRKAETFRVNFPQYKQKRVYLALAGMSFHPLTEQVCRESGIAIIKQVGETMMIHDEHLKAF